MDANENSYGLFNPLFTHRLQWPEQTKDHAKRTCELDRRIVSYLREGP